MRRSACAGAIAVCAMGLALHAGAQKGRRQQDGLGVGAGMKLESSAFETHGEIPRKYTCEGQDVSPPLGWSELPNEVKSLALIVDDPDAPDPKAPRMTWVHWVLFNVPPIASGLPENAGKQLPAGAAEGWNDWKRLGYGAPCPPAGRHRYFFKLYALDTVLDLARPTKAQLEQAMQGHVLAQAELIGTYQKEDQRPAHAAR